ncbi:MAG: DUF421 domain-containing protein [Chitinophagaceae bacterium]|nr:MAG: DUF421 domain-containing protein [Chitinophagaceae bacterium]
MNPVIRGVIIYLFLMLMFRLSGKRTLAQTTPFELVLLLIISEVTQQALLGEDFSITAAIILITTLIATDLIFSVIKKRSKKFEKITEGVPLVIFSDGIMHEQKSRRSRVDEEDVLEAARNMHGLTRLDQIQYAVLEIDGSISIVPKKQ